MNIKLDSDGWLYWYCNGHKNRTRPDDRNATLVRVTRERNGRRFDLFFYKKGPPLAAPGPLPNPRQFLCREVDKCGAAHVGIQSLAGDVVVKRGERKEALVRLRSDGYFLWWCGDNSDLDKTRPDNRETTLIVVDREPTGRRMDFLCYKELRVDK